MESAEFATQRLLEATGQSEHLTDREKHLIRLAVTVTRGCVGCTGNRLKKALQRGVPYETLVAGIDVAAAVNAGVTIAIATQGAERNDVAKPRRYVLMRRALSVCRIPDYRRLRSVVVAA